MISGRSPPAINTENFWESPCTISNFIPSFSSSTLATALSCMPGVRTSVFHTVNVTGSSEPAASTAASSFVLSPEPDSLDPPQPAILITIPAASNPASAFFKYFFFISCPPDIFIFSALDCSHHNPFYEISLQERINAHDWNNYNDCNAHFYGSWCDHACSRGSIHCGT